MILKVERYDSDQRWWMFDNIRKISMSNELFRREIHNKDYDVILFDMPKSACTCGKDGACSECEKYLLAICRLTDGSEISIAFDTTAYLLNDNGKTIEKIVANYKEIK